MVILDDIHRVGKTEGDRQLYLIFRLVLPVPALALGLPEHRLGQGLFPRQLLDVVLDAVFVEEIGGLEPAGGGLVLEPEGDPGVDHSLALHHIGVIFRWDINVRKHVQVGLPVEGGAGLFPGVGLFLEPAHVLAFFKVEGVLEAVPADEGVKVLAGVLGGAGAQTVEAEGVLVVVVPAAVLAAGVELAEHQLPVELALLLVPVHRAAPAQVLHLDGVVQETGDRDEVAVALLGFVDGVGEDLKDGVLTAVQPVGAKDDAGALADPVGPLQGGDG